MSRRRGLAIGALLSIVGGAPAAGAQASLAADSLLQRGSMMRAESLYYAAVRAKPRDPLARWELGRYLAQRGAPRVAATLMTEAIQFGGPSWAALVGPDLARIDVMLGEYGALAILPASALQPGERERVQWLESHPSRTVAPDSTLVAVYQPHGAGIGRIPLRVNGHTVEALVSTDVRGVVLDDSLAALWHVHRFGNRLGAADSIGIGRLSMTNAPLTVDVGRSRRAGNVMVGLDVLAPFEPTFDPRNARVTLHVQGRAESARAGSVHATRLTNDDFLILQAGGWLSASAPAISRILTEHRWTMLTRRGSIRIED